MLRHFNATFMIILKTLFKSAFCLLLLCTLNAQAQSNINSTSTPQKEFINVMPYPQSVQMGSGRLYITTEFLIHLSGAPKDQTLEAASNRFIRKLKARTLTYFEQEKVILNSNNPTLSIFKIQVKEKTEPFIGVNETYQLVIDSSKAVLTAPTTIGALRGLETVLQLVQADAKGFYLPTIKIDDAPRFRWRGMMLDVARHFLPIDVLKRNIDAMAMVKLNVLHLHLSDDEGFRVESKVFPKLHELGSNGQFYTQEELKGIIQYAQVRGIMVYPEFDLPGHSTSWFAGYPELASAPGPYQPGHRYKIKPGSSMGEAINTIMKAATPTLNPTKESTYQFLEKFISEMVAIFPAPYLHIGADENNGAAWNENPQIVQFMAQQGIKDVHQLQAYFVRRMHTILKKHQRTSIGWEELYDAELPKNVIVQVWGAIGPNRPTPQQIAQQGTPVLISKGFYLDYFYPAYIHYLNSNIPVETNANILGGEAALWSELVDENSFETRAWPRTAAAAERLWSPESVKDIDDMYRRLFVLSDRLEEIGLNHRLNTTRLLSGLCSGQDIQSPLRVLETLAPARGYGRLLTQFVAPERSKYQQAPLVDLPDLLSCDSEAAWLFRKKVEQYLSTKDQSAQTAIIQQLNSWKEAALKIPALTTTTPNLKEFDSYAAKVAQAADIGLQVLTKLPDEKDKAALLQNLKAMKNRGDKLEIQILPEIQALVSGTLPPLPMGF